MKLTLEIGDLCKKSQNGKIYKQWIVTVLLNITVLSTGIQAGWPAYTAKVLQSDDSPIDTPLSSFDISWLTSSPNLAALLTVPFWTILVDKSGRKICAIICAVLQAVSWTIILLAGNKLALMTGRIVGGISDSGSSYIIAMYIKELSQDDIRGALGMLRNLSRNLGILAIYLMGGYVSYDMISTISLSISVIGVLGVLGCPESPTYHIKIGKVEDGSKVIANMRSLKAESIEVQRVVDAIKAEDIKFKSIQNVTFITVFKQKAWRRGFVLMILLMFFQTMSGCYTVINYTPAILEMLKVSLNPELLGLSVPIFMLVGSLLSMAFIECLGRKPILMASYIVSLVSFGALAGIIMLHNHGVETPDWLAVLMLVLPMFAYATAVYPIPFVIMAEMFNFQIRAKLMGCVCMVGRVVVSIQTLIFSPLSDAFGPHVTFLFYAAMNLCATLLVLHLPETKKKSVEEIELELERK